jgi:uncharacterized membrane protein
MKGAQAEKFIDPALSMIVEEGISAVRTFTINRTLTELFQSTRDLRNFSTAMKHMDACQLVSNDLELLEEIPNRKIAWATRKETEIYAYGTIEFLPSADPTKTEVRISMKYDVSKGKLLNKWDQLFGDKFEDVLFEDIRHFKQLMETGEIPTIEGQPRGHCARS